MMNSLLEKEKIKLIFARSTRISALLFSADLTPKETAIKTKGRRKIRFGADQVGEK